MAIQFAAATAVSVAAFPLAGAWTTGILKKSNEAKSIQG
jgi:hypothetical protein